MNDADVQIAIHNVVQGGTSAFEDVYALTKDHVYRTVYFLAKNKQDVGDIMSEVYIELFRSMKNYNVNQPFRTWLNGLIIRQVQNWHRKQWRKLRIFHRAKQFEVELPSNENDEHLIQSETQAELNTLIDQLSYKLKAVIVLRYYHEHTFEEIATILNVPLGTVKSRHQLALQKLRLQVDSKLANKEASTYVH